MEFKTMACNRWVLMYRRHSWCHSYASGPLTASSERSGLPNPTFTTCYTPHLTLKIPGRTSHHLTLTYATLSQVWCTLRLEAPSFTTTASACGVLTRQAILVSSFVQFSSCILGLSLGPVNILLGSPRCLTLRLPAGEWHRHCSSLRTAPSIC